MKIFEFPVPLPDVAYPLPAILLAAGAIEVVGGGFLLIGLFTGPIAFLAAGEMAFAYFLAHAPRSFWPGTNDGADAILFCFIFLYLSVAGGGTIAVDNLVARKRKVGQAPHR